MHEYKIFPKAFNSYKPSEVFGVILISEDNKILMVKGRKAFKWSFPKGHIKQDETWSQCAVRECFEETGIYIPDHFDIKQKKPHKLFSGHYYVYKNTEEIKPILMDNSDTSEILEVAWIPIKDIYNIRRNIDVNNFLNTYDRISNDC